MAPLSHSPSENLAVIFTEENSPVSCPLYVLNLTDRVLTPSCITASPSWKARPQAHVQHRAENDIIQTAYQMRLLSSRSVHIEYTTQGATFLKLDFFIMTPPSRDGGLSPYVASVSCYYKTYRTVTVVRTLQQPAGDTAVSKFESPLKIFHIPCMVEGVPRPRAKDHNEISP